MKIKEKLKNCYRILFKNKPISTITYGVKVIRCDECEYNLKCEECAYKELAKNRPDFCSNKQNKLRRCEDCHDKECSLNSNIIYKDFMKGTEK